MEVTENDVQKWLLLILYERSSSIRDIYKDGCKKMIYSREPNDLKRTLTDMQKNGLIHYNIVNMTYSTSDNGVFRIHKDIFLPYLGLDREKIITLIGNLREKSDREFLKSLDGQGRKFIINEIISYGYYHLQNILIIKDLIIQSFGS